MDTDFSKFWVAGAGMLFGAIAGAWIWAQRAAVAVGTAAERAGEDALIHVAQSVGTSSIAAALKGAGVGAIVGLIAAAAYVYFSDPDRGMRIRKVDVNDNY